MLTLFNQCYWVYRWDASPHEVVVIALSKLYTFCTSTDHGRYFLSAFYMFANVHVISTPVWYYSNFVMIYAYFKSLQWLLTFLFCLSMLLLQPQAFNTDEDNTIVNINTHVKPVLWLKKWEKLITCGILMEKRISEFEFRIQINNIPRTITIFSEIIRALFNVRPISL